MSRDDNIQAVRGAYAAFGRGDIQGVLDCFAENVEWTAPGPPDLLTAGRRQGRQQVAEFFRIVGELFEFHTFIPATFVADGSRVIVLGTEQVSFKPTGARLPEIEWVHAFTFENGKVAHFQEYFDTSAIAAQLQGAKVRT